MMSTLNMLIAFITLQGLLFMTENQATDTLQVRSTGYNLVVIDSLITGTGSFVADSAGIYGHVNQTGRSNSVEITTPPATGSDQQKSISHKISVTQTGKNNSVRINSR